MSARGKRSPETSAPTIPTARPRWSRPVVIGMRRLAALAVWAALADAGVQAGVRLGRAGRHRHILFSSKIAAYAALDVSQEATAICVVDEAGRVAAEKTLATCRAVISTWLGKHASGLVRIGMETGSLAVWLLKELHVRGGAGRVIGSPGQIGF